MTYPMSPIPVGSPIAPGPDNVEVVHGPAPPPQPKSFLDMDEEERKRFMLLQRAVTLEAKREAAGRISDAQGYQVPPYRVWIDKDTDDPYYSLYGGVPGDITPEEEQARDLAFYNAELTKRGLPEAKRLPVELTKKDGWETWGDLYSKEYLPFGEDLVDFHDAWNLRTHLSNMKTAIEEGRQPDVTDMEYVVAFEEKNLKRLRNTTWWGGAWNALFSSLQLGTEYAVGGALTKGALKGAKLATAGAGRAMKIDKMINILDEGLKGSKIAKSYGAAKRGADKVVEKAIQKFAPAADSWGARFNKGAKQLVVRGSTVLPSRVTQITNNWMDYATDYELTMDELGRLGVAAEVQDLAWKYLPAAIANEAIEVYSEQASRIVDPIGFAAGRKIFNANLILAAQRKFPKLANGVMGMTDVVSDKLSIGSALGEGWEEIVGNAANQMVSDGMIPEEIAEKFRAPDLTGEELGQLLVATFGMAGAKVVRQSMHEGPLQAKKLYMHEGFRTDEKAEGDAAPPLKVDTKPDVLKPGVKPERTTGWMSEAERKAKKARKQRPTLDMKGRARITPFEFAEEFPEEAATIAKKRYWSRSKFKDVTGGWSPRDAADRADFAEGLRQALIPAQLRDAARDVEGAVVWEVPDAKLTRQEKEYQKGLAATGATVHIIDQDVGSIPIPGYNRGSDIWVSRREVRRGRSPRETVEGLLNHEVLHFMRQKDPKAYDGLVKLMKEKYPEEWEASREEYLKDARAADPEYAKKLEENESELDEESAAHFVERNTPGMELGQFLLKEKEKGLFRSLLSIVRKKAKQHSWENEPIARAWMEALEGLRGAKTAMKGAEGTKTPPKPAAPAEGALPPTQEAPRGDTSTFRGFATELGVGKLPAVGTEEYEALKQLWEEEKGKASVRPFSERDKAPVGAQVWSDSARQRVLTIRRVPISDIALEPANKIYPATVKKYRDTPGSRRPVLIRELDKLSVDDGHHRILAAQERGETHIVAAVQEPVGKPSYRVWGKRPGSHTEIDISGPDGPIIHQFGPGNPHEVGKAWAEKTGGTYRVEDVGNRWKIFKDNQGTKWVKDQHNPGKPPVTYDTFIQMLRQAAGTTKFFEEKREKTPEELKFEAAAKKQQEARDVSGELTEAEKFARAAQGQKPEAPEVERTEEGNLKFPGMAAMRRAVGPVFHGTDADFKSFRPTAGALGIHFGTHAQASNIFGDDQPKRTLRRFLDIKNPLRMSDLGGWVGYAAKEEFEKTLGTTIPGAGSAESIVRAVQAAGFDSIVYSNRFEGEGDSYIVFTDEAIKGSPAFRGTAEELSAIQAEQAQADSDAFRFRQEAEEVVGTNPREALRLYAKADAASSRSFFLTAAQAAKPALEKWRAEQGKPAVREGGFVSPAIREDITLEEAAKMMRGDEHARAKQRLLDILLKAGVEKPVIREAVGVWEDGAEPTFYVEWSQNDSLEDTIRSLAGAGLEFRQKEIIAFKEEPAEGEIIEINVPNADVVEVSKVLTEHGLIYQTIAPTQTFAGGKFVPGVMALAVNSFPEYFKDTRKAARAAAKALGVVDKQGRGNPKFRKGNAEFVGHQPEDGKPKLRIGGAKVFKDILSKKEEVEDDFAFGDTAQAFAVQTRATRSKADAPRSVEEIKQFLLDGMKKRHGRQLDPANKADWEEAVQAAVEEAQFQRGIPNDKSEEWYAEDIRQALRTYERVFHDMQDSPEKKLLMLAFLALTSPQMQANLNAQKAGYMMQDFLETGKVPRYDKRGQQDAQGQYADKERKKELTPWEQDIKDRMDAEGGSLWTGSTGWNVAKATRVLEHIIESRDERGAIEFLLSPQSLRTLAETRRASGAYKAGQTLSSYKPFSGHWDTRWPGAYIFGPKVGPFFLNLNGIEDVTGDRWATRTFQRHFGQLEIDSEDDSPTEKNRPIIKKFFRDVGKRMGISAQAAQSILWFFEQGLYRDLGARRAKSETFSEGAREFAEATAQAQERAVATPGDIEGKPAIRESPGGRPPLANIGKTDHARAELDKVDKARKVPHRPHAVMQEEARQRVEADREGELQRLLDSTYGDTGINEADVWVGRELFNQLSDQAEKSGKPEDYAALARLGLSYRQAGTETARAMSARRDLTETPEERHQRYTWEAIVRPPASTGKRIVKLQKQAAEQTGEAKRKTKQAIDREFDNWGRKVPDVIRALEGEGYDPKRLKKQFRNRRDAARAVRIAQAHKGIDSFSDLLYEYWRNSILSGLGTQAANVIGNTGHILWHFLAERSVAATANKMLPEFLGGKSGQDAKLGEVGWMKAALATGWSRGVANFREAWDTEDSVLAVQLGIEVAYNPLDDPGASGHMKPGAIPTKYGGRIVRAPQRALLAMDEMNKTMAAHMEVAALAYRHAVEQGWDKSAIDRYVREQLLDMGSEWWQQAYQKSLEMTFQERDKVIEWALKGRNVIPGARYVVPFVTTLWNIARLGIRKSPLGFASLAHKLIKWNRERARIAEDPALSAEEKREQWLALRPPDLTQAWAEQAWAALFTLAIVGLTGGGEDEQWITGAAPGVSDRERDRGYNVGIPPSSIRIPGTDIWVSYARVEPMATLLGTIADAVTAVRRGVDGDINRALNTAVAGMLGQVRDKTMAKGVQDVMNIFDRSDSSDKAAAKWMGSFAASWMPNLVRQPIRGWQDHYPKRQVWGEGYGWLSMLGVRTLQRTELGTAIYRDLPIRDLYGEPAERFPPSTNFWATVAEYAVRSGVLPVKVDEQIFRPGDRLIGNWWARGNTQTVGRPEPTYTVNGKTHYLTPEQYDKLSEVSGKAVPLVMEQWGLNEAAPQQADWDAFRGIFTKARKITRDAVLAGESITPDEVAGKVVMDSRGLVASRATSKTKPSTTEDFRRFGITSPELALEAVQHHYMKNGWKLRGKTYRTKVKEAIRRVP